MLHCTTAEFCLQYMQWCYEERCTITPEGFLECFSAIENETFGLVGEVIFNFVLAVHVQKLGVRCNDTKMISAGRYKFMPLFYAFNHPIYQDIEYYDLQNMATYPKETKELLDDNMSFSSSQLDHKHQGGDFAPEGKIKRHKMVAPKGIVSNEMWKCISRGFDKIEGICKQADFILNIQEDDIYKEIDIYDEITTWRALIRSSEMLGVHKAVGVVTNIYGEPLSEDMFNLTENSNEKMKLFRDLKIQGDLKKGSIKNLQIKVNLDLDFEEDEEELGDDF